MKKFYFLCIIFGYILTRFCDGISNISGANSYSAHIIFQEQAIPSDPFLRSIDISIEMTCNGVSSCTYQTVIDNMSPSYFDVLINQKECPNNDCSNEITYNEIFNITLVRDHYTLDIFDFHLIENPQFIMLGCTMENNLVCYNSSSIFHDTTTLRSWSDSVFVSNNNGYNCQASDYGYCYGLTTWWKPTFLTSSSSTKQTTPPKPTTVVFTTPSTPTSTKQTTTTKTTTFLPNTTTTTISRTVPTTPTTTIIKTTPTSTPIPTTTGSLTLKQLSDDGVGLNNISSVLNETYVYSKMGIDLVSTQITEITNILKNSANLVGISTENSYQILHNMDCVLNATETEMVKSGDSRQQLLELLKTIVHNTDGSHIRYLEGSNIGFTSKKIDCSNITSDDGLLDLGHQFELINETSIVKSTQLNAIMVPLNEICSSQEVSHLFFTIHRQQKLFTGKQQFRSFGRDGQDPEEFPDADSDPSGPHEKSKRAKRHNEFVEDYVPLLPPPSKCSSQISVASNTPVMSATLMHNGQTISAIQSTPVMANLQFNIKHIPSPLHGSFRVTWWDVGRETWATDRPCKIISIKDGIVDASCEHLTDFTVIVDGSIDDRIVCDKALIITGYVVNALSIVSLIFLAILGSLVYVRADVSAKVLFYLRGQILTKGDVVNLAYNIVLLMFYILFVFFADQSNFGNQTTCTVTAAFMYFLLISSIMLNLLQGIRTIYTFLPRKLRTFFHVMVSPPAALTIGIVIPFMLSLLLAVFDSEFFERNDSFCWVRPDYITYAIVVPISILLLNALICTAFVTYKMFFATKRKLSKGESSYYDAEFWSKLASLIIMQITLGVPWVIQYFTLQWPGTSFWHYLFTIILGSQGTILLLIFFYRRQKLIQESRRSSERTKKMENSVNSYYESEKKQEIEG